MRTQPDFGIPEITGLHTVDPSFLRDPVIKEIANCTIGFRIPNRAILVARRNIGNGCTLPNQATLVACQDTGDSCAYPKQQSAFFLSGNDDGMKIAHLRMGHTGISTIERILKSGAATGMEKLMSTKSVGNICDNCIEGKAYAKTHKRRDKTSTCTLQLMHTDIISPITPEGLNGEKYAQLLVDDYSGSIWVRCYARKSKATYATKEMILEAQKLSGAKTITLRSDGAKELTLGATQEFLEENDTLNEITPPYSPQSMSGLKEQIGPYWKRRGLFYKIFMACQTYPITKSTGRMHLSALSMCTIAH